mgnify:CR=1 FL=1
MNEQDRVIGKATRSEIHKNNLLHRSAHILVFNFNNQLFLQKRSISKDESPGLWDTSSAGHVNSGESYEACAYRELWEELGIKTVLTPLIKIDACKETHHEHIQFYICKTDANIKINQEEISEGKYFNFSELIKEIHSSSEKYTSSLKLILSDYAEKILKDAKI